MESVDNEIEVVPSTAEPKEVVPNFSIFLSLHD
jgi:hypothetical protein